MDHSIIQKVKIDTNYVEFINSLESDDSIDEYPNLSRTARNFVEEEKIYIKTIIEFCLIYNRQIENINQKLENLLDNFKYLKKRNYWLNIINRTLFGFNAIYSIFCHETKTKFDIGLMFSSTIFTLIQLNPNEYTISEYERVARDLIDLTTSTLRQLNYRLVQTTEILLFDENFAKLNDDSFKQDMYADLCNCEDLEMCKKIVLLYMIAYKQKISTYIDTDFDIFKEKKLNDFKTFMNSLMLNLYVQYVKQYNILLLQCEVLTAFLKKPLHTTCFHTSRFMLLYNAFFKQLPTTNVTLYGLPVLIALTDFIRNDKYRLGPKIAIEFDSENIEKSLKKFKYFHITV